MVQTTSAASSALSSLRSSMTVPPPPAELMTTQSSVVTLSDSINNTSGTTMWDRVRGRQTFNSSDFVFSIDGDGRGPRNDAILDSAFYLLTPGFAESAFFNVHLYGSLRKGGPVALLSRKYGGYVISAVVSGYMDASIKYTLLRLAPAVLGLTESAARDLEALLNLRWVVVVLFGVASDSFAPFGYRRNVYIVGAWMVLSLLWGLLFVLFQCSKQAFGSDVPPSAVAVSFIAGASLMLAIATCAADIRVIELSQQETLHWRGQVLATYHSLRIGAQAVVHALTLATFSPSSSSESRIELTLPVSIDFFVLHLAIFALIPIVFIVHNAHEEKLALNAAAPNFSQTCQRFWQSMQQKAIWHFVAINCLLFFFVLLDASHVNTAISIWTGESANTQLLHSLVSSIAFVATLLIWGRCGINANWVTVTGVVLVSWCLVFCSSSTLIVLDILRFPWMNIIVGIFQSGLRVLLLLSAFVPAIELASNGTEGTTFGILSSFQSITTFLGTQALAAVENHSLTFSVEELQSSSSSIQATLFYAVLALTGAKLLSVLALFFCPQQKLDAQQHRIYGGYSRTALLAFAFVYAVGVPVVVYFQYVRFAR
ncbi:hypothetical protein FI667_g17428, partial [Globisporangium splendens]